MTDSHKLITYAQQYLAKQPFDIVHDLEHHQLVAINCELIITQEKITPDQEVIMTAAWWHDVEKSYATANSSDSTVIFFQSVAKELNIPENFVQMCCQVIGEHSYNQTQTTLESRILFDADKIEYVNDARIAKLVDDFMANPDRYSVESLLDTHRIWLERIKHVPNMMHFNWSKQRFLTKLQDTRDVLARLKVAVGQ